MRPKIVTVIGRGSSASRLITNTLYCSGFFMGSLQNLNISYDKEPYQLMYDIAKSFLKKIVFDRNSYDLKPAINGCGLKDIEDIRFYLNDILTHGSAKRGWKLPETTFIYPWLSKLYPEFYYIHWQRNPMRNAPHYSDKMLNSIGAFGGLENPDISLWSWKIQYDIVNSIPNPERFITVKMEDFIGNQDQEIERLSDFLGEKIEKLQVYKNKTEYPHIDMPDPVMHSAKKLGY
jgi:hypothetical protein